MTCFLHSKKLLHKPNTVSTFVFGAREFVSTFERLGCDDGVVTSSATLSLLDSTVAGGINSDTPLGIKAESTPRRSFKVESTEEARLRRALNPRSDERWPTSTKSKLTQISNVFDLEIMLFLDREMMVEEFPRPGADGLEEVVQMDWREEFKRMLSCELKPTSCPVRKGFMERNGVTLKEIQSEVEEILCRLRSLMHVPMQLEAC
ncbi:hypothetical protein CEK25_013041 [Fusarium fujikuroi]|nr:hypothetical protein CEK25_013041 [Fusarium fujikuroi]